MKKTREQLKAELMGKLEEKVDEILDWQEEHAKYRLIELEEYLLGVGEKMTGAVAEELIGQRESKQLVDAPECVLCGKQTMYKGQKRKRVVSQVGEVDIERGYYWCEQCRRGFFPPG